MSLALLLVLLVMTLVGVRAVVRGREHSRRLTVLVEAGVHAQGHLDRRQVVDTLVDDARRLLRTPDVEVRDTGPGPGEIGVELPLGTTRHLVAPVRRRARTTTTADEHALRALGTVAEEALARLKLTDDMLHFARHDLLTDLVNRGVLMDRLAYALAGARSGGTPVSLVFVDLDGFKPVNDRFGHAAGDTVLVHVAERLRACVRDDDTVARLGGDEFAVLFEGVAAPGVEAACRRILAVLSEGLDIAGHGVPLGASIGVAHDDGRSSAEHMLRNADLAMYEAKARGKDRVVVYEQAMGRARLERLELIEELRYAIHRAQLDVVYQPVVDAATGRVAGVEALARWQCGDLDVPPDVFIKIAEETGLVVGLGAVVLARVARDVVAMRAVDPTLHVNVNVSARQLREPGFVATVAETIGAVDGDWLILELTEREGIGRDSAVLEAMATITAMGVRFAIDDFGVGFSSISYLREVPAHVIKVDAALSRDIDTDARAAALLRSITMMGDALGLRVVVEGVEREAQLARIREDPHAPLVQGYVMHRPMPLPALLAVLAAQSRSPESALRPLRSA